MKTDEIFKNSAKIVFRFFDINVLDIENLKVHPDNMPIELSAYIGITGNPTGLVSFEMRKEIADKIITVATNKVKVSKDKTSMEIIREIANQVCGNALTELWQHGYDSEMTPPSLIFGDEIVYHHNRECKKSFFLFDTNCGKFLLKTFLHLK